MTTLHPELRHLIEAGPLAHLSTINVVEPSDHTWDLVNGLTKIYLSPDAEFPGANRPGYIVRYTMQRVTGVGPWAPRAGA